MTFHTRYGSPGWKPNHRLGREYNRDDAQHTRSRSQVPREGWSRQWVFLVTDPDCWYSSRAAFGRVPASFPRAFGKLRFATPASLRMTTYQDNSSPKVTVAIPTYRGAAYLGAAIDSVLNQTFGDFELLVLDDNSPDDTAAVVSCFPDPRIVYRRNSQNLGPLGNWNRCLAEGRGDYFKLLPHDDVLHSSCLERQVAVLDADLQQRVAMVFSSRDILSPDGERLTRRGYPGNPNGLLPATDVMRSCIRRGTNLIGEPGAVLFRKSLAERVGGFDATYPYVIDLDYWFRLLRHGDAYYFREPLAGFRVSGASWSVAIGASQSADFGGFASSATSPATPIDRMIGRVTAVLNNLARLVFYRTYLR